MNNEDARSSIFPLNNYIGERPNPNRDPYTKVKFDLEAGPDKSHLKDAVPEGLMNLAR